MLQPLKSNVIVRRAEAVEQVGSILIPPTARTEQVEAIVLAVGPAVAEVKVNDRVILAKYAGTNVGDGLLLPESDILAVIGPDPQP